MAEMLHFASLFTEYLLRNFPLEPVDDFAFCIPTIRLNRNIESTDQFKHEIKSYFLDYVTVDIEFELGFTEDDLLFKVILSNSFKFISSVREYIRRIIKVSTFSNNENRYVNDIKLIRNKRIRLKDLIFELKYLNREFFKQIIDDLTSSKNTEDIFQQIVDEFADKNI